ncbi:MAG: C39 family peptidase [Thermoflexales bacterium]|nr:C39 family peptidase [Thermoflexales bacterium]
MKDLSAPHFQQQADGFCLPACAQMVLAHLGIVASQDDLARQMGLRSHIGIPYSRIMRLQSPRLQVYYSVRGEMETLRSVLARGLPVILFVQAGELPHWRGQLSQHAIVVVGMGDREARVLDPAAPTSPVSVPLDDLMLAWDEMDNAYAVISLRE